MTNKQNRPGMLIIFEGIDGTGKSTQVQLLSDQLRKLGCDVVNTFEPTDGPFGKKIRSMFTNRASLTRTEELALFMDDRRWHVKDLIAPALAAGKVVISDRYYFSTAAYQGAAGLDPEQIIAENETFAPVPDCVLLLEASVTLGRRRIEESRQENPNDFEKEEGLRKVSAVFTTIQRDYIRRIDASQSIEAVALAVWEQVLPLIVARGLEIKSC
ncbi:MAG: dTMP kinase [Desulfobulbaceae bacterium]|nr:dTMP kinase [Desulfobulbaceae bacterium]